MGSKSVIFAGTFEAASRVVHAPLDRSLGGAGNPDRLRVSLHAPSAPASDVVGAFLEVTTLSRASSMRSWRLRIDGVPLARMFSPSCSVVDKRGLELASIIFDVSPIIRRDPGRESHVLDVSWTASDPVRLLSVSLVKILASTGCRSSIKYVGGCFKLAPGEALEIDGLGGEASRSALSFVAFSPDQNGVIEVLGSEGAKRLQVTSSVQDFEVELERADDVVLRVPHGFSQSYLFVPSIVYYSTTEAGPHIEVDASVEERGLLVRVKNTGSAQACSVQIVVLALGQTVSRKHVGVLEPGASVEHLLPLEEPRKPRQLSVRVVWNQHGQAKFIEKRLSPAERQR
ncbi:MAG: hypothetical protein QXU97_03645 [Fervidicoccaceae archaeon]